MIGATEMEHLARKLWGDPNPQHSTRDDLRFGQHGSKSVRPKDCTWYDHKAGEGGGYADLYERVYGNRPADASVTTAYDYHDATGALVFQVVRKVPKMFRQRRPDGNGGWLWDMRGVERVPYRLPDLRRAEPGTTIFVCEGEKDCNALHERGLIATTNPGGAGKWQRSMSLHLRDRHVVILPDNDEAGENHARDVAAKLQGIARTVRIMRLPDLPDKGDVSDWLAAGGTAEELERLCDKAEPADPAPIEAKSAPLWVDADDWIEAQIPLRPWVAPGYLLRGAVTLLCGPPSILKSSLALGWACATALHRTLGRFHPTGAAPVIVYNVEDDATEQRRRLSATLRQFGATPGDIRGQVIRTGPNAIGTLLTRNDSGDVVSTAAMERLVALIIEWKPAVLVVDPLAELHTSEENDNTALRAVIAGFRQIAIRHNIAILILHHTRKGGGASPGDPDSARGASAIIGAVRIALTVTGMSEDDAKTFGLPTDAQARAAYVRLDDAKQNYVPNRDAEWFEKHVYILDSGEAVPAATPWQPPKPKAATQADLVALASVIARGTSSGEPWSPKLDNNERSVRHVLQQHGFNGSDTERKVLQRLQSECSVIADNYRRPSPSRVKAKGFRIADKPAAEWLTEPHE